MTDRRDRHHPGHPPRLAPTGSVDRVFLIGGKNLTPFQSVGLAVVGLCFALGVGVPLLVNESYLESQLARFGYHRSLAVMVFGSVMILWGGVMIPNGLLGISRRIWKRNRS